MVHQSTFGEEILPGFELDLNCPEIGWPFLFLKKPAFYEQAF